MVAEGAVAQPSLAEQTEQAGTAQQGLAGLSSADKGTRPESRRENKATRL